jgi:type I restriction enzyme, S subunit
MTTFAELIRRGALILNDGYRTKQAELAPSGIPILRVAEIGDGFISPRSEDRISEEYRAAIGVKLSEPGDVLLTTKGTVGRRAIVPEGGAGYAYSPQVCFFRTLDGSIDRRWLYYWLGGTEFWDQAFGVSTQTDMAPYISLRDLRSIQIELPPPEEQRAIGETLGALDDKIQSDWRTVELAWSLLESQWVALTRAARWSPLSRALSLSYGKALPANTRKPGTVPVYGSNGITGWHDSALVPGPAVIVGRKGSIGEVHWSASAAYPIDTTFYVNAANGYPLLGCFFALRLAGLTEMNSDSAIPGLNRDRALGVEVPLPEADEANAWAAQAAEILALIAARNSERERLIALREAIAPELFSGRLAAPAGVTV